MSRRTSTTIHVYPKSFASSDTSGDFHPQCGQAGSNGVSLNHSPHSRHSTRLQFRQAIAQASINSRHSGFGHRRFDATIEKPSHERAGHDPLFKCSSCCLMLIVGTLLLVSHQWHKHPNALRALGCRFDSIFAGVATNQNKEDRAHIREADGCFGILVWRLHLGY